MCAGLKLDTPDRSRLAGGDKLFERLPRGDVFVTLRPGPVDEEQIDVVQPEPLEGFVQAHDRAVIALVGAVQFGGDEEVLAANAAVSDALAHAALVAIARSSVDVPVPGLYRGDDHRRHLCVAEWPSAQANLGDGVAVVEKECRCGHGFNLSLACSGLNRVSSIGMTMACLLSYVSWIAASGGPGAG